jgi:hypothetical protein
VKFIEVIEGTSVLRAEIEAIKDNGEGGAIIYTHHNQYNSTFPYQTLLQLLEVDMPDDKSEDSGTLKNIQNMIQQQGHFAG